MGEAHTEEPSSVTLALRLGWSLSEFMGRAHRTLRSDSRRVNETHQPQSPKELRGFADDEVPRLTYSNRYFSPEGAWWQSALRLLSLAEQLDILDEDDEVREKICRLPDQVYAIIFGQDVETDSRRPSPRDFYNLLEPWSRKVGVCLAARSDRAALAFKVGGQIADTYWFMRDKDRYGEPRDRHKQDSWHQLLNHKRLTPIIEDIKLFEEDLPPLVGECLRFSIYRWMIAHDLEYQGDRLNLVRNKRRKDHRLEREEEGILKQIESDDERRIIRQLEMQATIWRALILGTRGPARYLKRGDRRRIFWKAVGHYLLSVLGAMAVLTAIGYLLIILLGSYISTGLTSLLEILTPDQMQPAALDKSISILTEALPLITAAIVFIGSMLRDGWTETRGLWQRNYEAVRKQEIKKSTWVPVQLSSFAYRLRHWRSTD